MNESKKSGKDGADQRTIKLNLKKLNSS
jgi:hypothetical protein